MLYGRLFYSIEPLSMLNFFKTFLRGVKLLELIIVHLIINYNLFKLLTNVTGSTIAVRGQTRLASSIDPFLMTYTHKNCTCFSAYMPFESTKFIFSVTPVSFEFYESGPVKLIHTN